MSKNKQLVTHSLPLILGILLSYLFWQEGYLLLILYVGIVSIVIFSGKDRKIELNILIYGIIAGIVIEVIGTQVAGYQSFIKPDFAGIPFWLPVSWGYGFILMKRISLIIATGSPWT